MKPIIDPNDGKQQESKQLSATAAAAAHALLESYCSTSRQIFVLIAFLDDVDACLTSSCVAKRQGMDVSLVSRIFAQLVSRKVVDREYGHPAYKYRLSTAIKSLIQSQSKESSNDS